MSCRLDKVISRRPDYTSNQQIDSRDGRIFRIDRALTGFADNAECPRDRIARLTAEAPSLSWNANLLRFTLFLKEPFDTSGLWQALTGEPPSIDEHRPKQFYRRQAGRLGEGNLELQSNPQRLDFLLTPIVEEESPENTEIWFASVETAFESMSAVVETWLNRAPEVQTNRLAFGVVALIPTKDREAAYAILADLVPSVQLDPENTSQFLYQINRPKLSRNLDGAKFNRVTTWNALIIMKTIISNLSGIVTNSLPSRADSRHFVRLECDNSTPAERADALDSALILPIYTELKEMAVENLRYGEIV